MCEFLSTLLNQGPSNFMNEESQSMAEGRLTLLFKFLLHLDVMTFFVFFVGYKKKSTFLNFITLDQNH